MDKWTYSFWRYVEDGEDILLEKGITEEMFEDRYKHWDEQYPDLSTYFQVD